MNRSSGISKKNKRKSFNNLVCALSALAVFGYSGMCAEAADPSQELARMANQADPARDLNRTIEQLEREQFKKELTDKIGKKVEKVEKEKAPEQKQEAPAVVFKLNKVETDASEVLTQEEINKAAAEYVGKKITIDDIYKIVENINKLYDAKGYVTCRAFLPPQTITGGVVHITLIEGKTGETTVVGNKSTNADYILERVHLQKGKITDTNQLNKDLLRFNATNDVQLRIVMKAGKEVGTTDYTLEAYEPKQHQFTFLFDNLGNSASGLQRQGIFYTDRSHSGNRDAMTFGFIRSRGMKAASFGYSYPINKKGTKVNFSMSGNKVKSEFTGYNTDGRSLSFDLGIVEPVLTTEKTRSEYTFDLIHQQSQSDAIINSGARMQDIVNDKVYDAVFGFNMTKYGDSGVWFQRNALTLGRSSSNPTTGLSGDSSSKKKYGVLRHTEFYQKRVNANGDVYSLKGDWQHSFTRDMPSSRAFNIGGAYTVRGYKENYMTGDSGVVLSAEYQIPLDKQKQINAFVFMDYGRLYGENIEGDGMANDLYSWGLGLKTVIAKTVNANVTVGFPLKKHVEGKTEDADSSRVTFMVSGTF